MPYVFYVFVLALCITLSIPPFAGSQSLGSSCRNNASLFWGPYRPNLYFGMRARSPDSPLIGLMWAQREGDALVKERLRHSCEESDGMRGYGWTAYDPRYGGSQTIHDVGNGLDLSTNFVRSTEIEGSNRWAVRVKGKQRTEVKDGLKSSVALYVGVPGIGSSIGAKLDCHHIAAGVQCRGSTQGTGDFKLSVERAKSLVSGAESGVTLRGMNVPDDTLWQAESHYLEPEGTPGRAASNLYFIDMSFQGSFKFDILFSPIAEQQTISSAYLTRTLGSVLNDSLHRFESVYEPQPPFKDTSYTACSQAMLSNLLGGIGYFYGDSRVDTTDYDENELDFYRTASEARAQNRADVHPTNPVELFSMVPSRPFFPRGFLWDDGFHLLVVLDWDLDLTVEILMSWLARMDSDGWIAREQILGAEARSKVPPEFQVQYPTFANPPTLFLVISELCDILSSKATYNGHRSRYVEDPEAGMDLLRTLYPLMKRHYHWFLRTQGGNMTYSRPLSSKEGYRWRGRTAQHTLTSGLDDYPRAHPPHPGELHVDAFSWVGTMSATFVKLSALLNEVDDHEFFLEHYTGIKEAIVSLHWSEEEQAFCDASVDETERHVLVCHKGYISLFPFILGHMDAKDERVGAILDMLHDPNQLWSQHGIRSLSKGDRYYGTSENYWRSPIWININYLVLKELLNVASIPGPHRKRASDIYVQLRRNLGDTFYNSWRETGFAWEQYNPDTGAGQRTQHFTGWTALIVKIMAMPDMHIKTPILESPLKLPEMQFSKLWFAFAFLLVLILAFRRRLRKLL